MLVMICIVDNIYFMKKQPKVLDFHCFCLRKGRVCAVRGIILFHALIYVAAKNDLVETIQLFILQQKINCCKRFVICAYYC